MEILQNDDKLREEIIADAKKKAQRILKKADKDIQEFKETQEKELENFENEMNEKNNLDIDVEKKLILSSLDIEINHHNMQFIGNLIDQCFNDVAEKLKEQYSEGEILLALIKKAYQTIKSDQIYLEIGSNAPLALDKLKALDLFKNQKPVINKGDFKDGVKVYSADRKKMTYLSLERFLETIKAEKRNEVYEIIAGS